jgi:hypothetical protein
MIPAKPEITIPAEVDKVTTRKWITCQYCGNEIAGDVYTCSSCGGHQRNIISLPKIFSQVISKSHIETTTKHKNIYPLLGGFLKILGSLLILISIGLTIVTIFYAFSPEAADAARTGGIGAIIAPFTCFVLPLVAGGFGLRFLGKKCRNK